MHFYQGLYSMEFNVSGVAFKILTETDIALFGLVVVLFGGLKVTVCEVTLGSFEEEKACVAVVLGAFSAAFLIELSEVFEEVRIFQTFILLVVFLDELVRCVRELTFVAQRVVYLKDVILDCGLVGDCGQTLD
jgi:hypothetical protein